MANLNQAKILLVDDNEFVILLYKGILNDYECIVASNGLEAIEIFDKEQPDLVIMDIAMPIMDGFEATRLIKQRYPNKFVPIIVVTSSTDDETMYKSIECGADDFMTKPISRNAFKIKIKAINRIRTLSNDLQKKDRQYVFLTECLTEGLWLINEECDTTYVNKKMADMLGYKKEEIQKQDIFYFMNLKGVKLFKQNLLHHYDSNKNEFELEFIHKDRTLIITNVKLNHIYDDDKGIYQGVLVSVQDITERKILERSLKKKEWELINIGKLHTLGEMAAGLAHEINQPLESISLTTTYLEKKIDKDKLSKEDIKEDLDEIKNSVNRISKLIKNVRTFSRQDSFDFEKTDINNTILNALQFCERQLLLENIEIIKKLSDNIPYIEGEQYQLQQVWLNMFSNSRDSMNDKEKRIYEYKKQLIISTSHNEKDNIVEVRIRDNGNGIPQKLKFKIFEPFYTTKEVGKGTGLGLSISHGIIEKHGGQIKVESQEGVFTEFIITLPVK
ncbi:MAG: response regulator [Desulfobacterales bacterium]|nr:response regulator [Desulfobacterales bacterium]